MISTTEFTILLDSMSHDEFTELDALIEKMPERSDETILEAYYEIKRASAFQAIMDMLESDPLYKAMEAGMKWGDMDAPKPKVAHIELPEDDVDWIMPRMVLRKDIFSNFPVVVRQLNTRDVREVYAVEWHNDNFIKQRNDSSGWCEYDDFEETQYRRLFKALNTSRNWIVEDAHNGNELCRIIMVENDQPKQVVMASYSVKDAATKPTTNDGWVEVKGANSVSSYNGPRLTRLTEIKEHFPTAFWNKVEGVNVSTYNIGLLRKTNNVDKTKTNLIEALNHSAFWKVVAHKDNEHCCRIVMNVRK